MPEGRFSDAPRGLHTSEAAAPYVVHLKGAHLEMRSYCQNVDHALSVAMRLSATATEMIGPRWEMHLGPTAPALQHLVAHLYGQWDAERLLPAVIRSGGDRP